MVWLALVGLVSAGWGQVPAAWAGPPLPSVTVDTIRVGQGPNAVAVSPDGSRVYVTNWESPDAPGTLSVIATGRNTVVGSPVRVGSGPSAVAASPDGRQVYVNNSLAGSVSVVDVGTAKVVRTISLNGQSLDMGMSPDGRRLYLAIGSNNIGVPGWVSVIDTGTNKVVGKPITIGEGSPSVAVSPDGTRVYVANYRSGTVSVLDARGATVVRTIRVGSDPLHVAITPDGRRLYIARSPDQGGGTVQVIDTGTNKVVGEIKTGDHPSAVTVSPDGRRLYVTDSAAHIVSEIDTSTNTPVNRPISVGDDPSSVAVSPDSRRVYVTNSGSGTVSVITR